MRKGFENVDKRFDAQDKKIDDLSGAVAELAGQIRDYHQEMIMLCSHEKLTVWNAGSTKSPKPPA